MLNLFKMLGRGKKVKEKLSPEKRRELEQLAVAADTSDSDKKLSQVERDLTCFTIEEKRRFMASRDLIKFLPRTVAGGAITQTAKLLLEVTGKRASKQYVHQILYPSDPLSLFKRRNPTYKQIWSLMEQAISDMIRLPTESEMRAIAFLGESNKTLVENELVRLGYTLDQARGLRDKQNIRDKYRRLGNILSNLSQGNAVAMVDADSSKVAYVSGKLKNLGIKHTIVRDQSTMPPSSIFIPEVENDPWPKPESGAEKMSDWINRCITEHGVIRVVANSARTLQQNRTYAGDEVTFGGEVYKIFHMSGS